METKSIFVGFTVPPALEDIQGIAETIRKVAEIATAIAGVGKGSPVTTAGAIGVEIWNKVGTTPPAGESDLRFVAVDTNQPYVLDFDAADGGKTAYYWLRWVNPTGERGPWSEQAAATIAA